MPLSLRFVVPLALALAAIAYAVVPLVDRLTFQWFVRDLDTRGASIAKTAQEPLAELIADNREPKGKVLRYFERIIQDQRIYALGYCDRAGRIAYATAAFPKDIRCSTSAGNEEKSWVLPLAARTAARLGEPHRRRRRQELRRADRGARHELRAAAQRRDQAVRVLLLRRASLPWSRSSP